MNKIYWLTGLCCSGKTTLAKALAKQIDGEILDGDDIRKISNNTDFTPEGRKKHMLSVAELAYRFSKYTHVIVALVSPIKSVREQIKKKYPNVIEIYILCDIEECKRRDVKGMYKKALAGEIKNFTGVDAPYEAPDVERNKTHTPTTFVDTEIFDVEQCVEVILSRHPVKEEPYNFFIGRFQPLHQGHIKLINTILDNDIDVLIGLRNTGIDENNPYSIEERKQMFEKEFGDRVKVISIPDIKSVCYGRGVGYEIKEIKLDKETENISATKIRGGKRKRNFNNI